MIVFRFIKIYFWCGYNDNWYECAIISKHSILFQSFWIQPIKSDTICLQTFYTLFDCNRIENSWREKSHFDYDRWDLTCHQPKHIGKKSNQEYNEKNVPNEIANCRVLFKRQVTLCLVVMNMQHILCGDAFVSVLCKSTSFCAYLEGWRRLVFVQFLLLLFLSVVM